MKKATVFVVTVLLCLSLTGCIDILQRITRLSNGTEQNTIRITVSKTILAMASGLSGGEVDYDKLFDENELNTIDVAEYKQFSASVKKVNDPMDIGYLIDMNIDYRDCNTLNKINSSSTSFIPKYNGNKTTIHIDSLGNGSDSTEDNAMTAAFLSTGKYKLLLSKSCVNNIKKVILKTKEGETEYDFLDLYDEYLIEIPIPIIFMSAVELEIYS